MLNNARLTLTVAVCLSAMLTLVGCGGVGAAPLNGVGSLPGVTVSVSPAAMNITTGTTQPFTATVNNTSQAGVGWLVNGFPGGVNPSDGSTPFGVIDKDGNYTAPPFVPQPPTVTITAVATADNTASANAAASITGTPSPVSISPLTASLEVGRTVNGILVPGDVALFTASLRGSDSPLNWLVENKLNGDLNVGTITAVPGPLNQVVYTAPAVFPSAGTQVHITAQSILNPMEAATAVVNLLPVGSTLVSITSPKEPPTVQITKTQAFVASVTGATDTSVTWQVDGTTGGNPYVGTITASGLYTAPRELPVPPLSPQVIVTAVSNAQPGAQASIVVNLVPLEQITVEVTADPTACANPNSIPINSTLQFEALVTGASQNVIWQVQHVTGGNSTLGTITPDGLYTAPAQLPNPTMVVISAISVDDPQVSGNLPITISLTAATAVIVSPSKASVAVTLGLDLKATVLGGLTDSTVNWLVNGIPGGDAGTVGVVQNPQRDQSTCSTTVQYLAPATVPAPPLPNPVPIIAIAVDNTESAPSMVTITAQAQFTLQLSPSGQVNLMVGQTQKYNAQELADLNDSVTWSVSGKSCSGVACGTITPATSAPPQPYVATYTAPLIVPSPDNTVTVTVSSIHHPGVSALDVISLSTGVPSISIEPTSQTVPVGQTRFHSRRPLATTTRQPR